MVLNILCGEKTPAINKYGDLPWCLICSVGKRHQLSISRGICMVLNMFAVKPTATRNLMFAKQRIIKHKYTRSVNNNN